MKDPNLQTYNDKDVVNWYLHLNELLAVERNYFELHAELLKKGRVLDIGIGGGRTTAYLLKMCGQYTGIDYSENFVEACKKRFPKSDIRHMDARNLSDLGNNSFDLINFSFNGLDYVDLGGRVKCLSEINRVLKPGGLFFFSTHNRQHVTFSKAPWLLKHNGLIINLKTLLKLLPFLFRKMKNKRHETIQKEYAIINDSAHSYRLWTFYTSIGFLKEQLRDSGFDDVQLYTKSGKHVDENNPAEEWIFAGCKKIRS